MSLIIIIRIYWKEGSKIEGTQLLHSQAHTLHSCVHICMFDYGVISSLTLSRLVCPIIPVFFSEVFFFSRDLLEIVSWQRAAGVAIHLGSAELCLHTDTVILGKETVERSQAVMGGNIKALGTEGVFNSFDLPLLTIYLPSSSLLQRPFIAASDHISLLALLSQMLSPLCLLLWFLSVQLLLWYFPPSAAAPHTTAELPLCLLAACCSPQQGLSPFLCSRPSVLQL